jgi:hypothetical protein
MSDAAARGLLAVWLDIPEAIEADFSEWYDREHLAERAAVPGFRCARRYIAEAAGPKYFAFYETESLAVLTSPDYRHYLGPGMTAWSKRVMPQFRNNHRLCCALAASAGGGIGSVVAVARLPAADGIEQRLRSGALAAAIHVPGALGAQAWRSDLGATYPDGAPAGAAAEVVLVVQGIRADAAAAGLAAVLAPGGAQAATHRGLYRLLHALPA